MAIVTIRNVTKQFGTLVVLDDVSLELQGDERVGLIGANGAGKTTLFRLIAGELEPDLGTIIRARGLEIGHLRQEPDVLPDRTLHEEVGRAFDELLALERKLHELSDQMAACADQTGENSPAHRHEASHARLSELMEQYDRVNTRFIAAGGHTFEARMQEILSGLGFSRRDHDQAIGTMSGGQRCRAALARLLLEDRTLLLLDEPTNHLDIDAVRWLEKFLAGHRGGAVIISHDRYLLDRLCDRIVEVEARRVASYPGNYSNFVETKRIRELTQERQYEKDLEFIKKERDFIARHLAGQRTAEAKGRRTRLERRLAAGEFVTENVRARRSAKITFEEVSERTGDILRCDGLTMAYGDLSLFTNLNLRVAAGDRFGITGPNGTGKTTLLRIILGLVAPQSGTVSFEQKVTTGYYAQDQNTLDPNRTIVDEIRAARPEFSEHQARNFLAPFLFRGDDVFKRIGSLSGGEQSRVRLAILILQSPDVLILDEPTNHLDIASREVLEEALTEFPGTIITVSHDRYFLDRVVNRLLVLRPEGYATYAGNYSYYLEQVEGGRGADGKGANARASTTKSAARKEKKRGQPDQPRSGPSPYDRLSIEELESMVIDYETELSIAQERFGDPTVCRDPDALAELQEQVEEIERKLAEVDAAWQERAAQDT
jgi:ATP-binding cassette, subfamily F, member 3